jgi:hypothetical protein
MTRKVWSPRLFLQAAEGGAGNVLTKEFKEAIME